VPKLGLPNRKGPMAKRVVIFGTCGADVDAKALKAVVRFVSDTQPDEIVCTDYQSIPFLVGGLREVYDGPLSVHGDPKNDPFDEMLSRFGARLLREHHQIASGWITAGTTDGVPDSRIGGNTALKTARKYNTSVVLGHTGRMGIASHTYGFSGQVDKVVTGVEVGHLMDIKKLRARIKTGKRDVVGSALAATLRELNLQQGFGMLTIEGEHVQPELVAIHRGRFAVDGETWEV